jgi:protein SCO1/2
MVRVRTAIAFTLLAVAAGTAGAAAPVETFPNVALRTQDGTTVRFYDDLVKGKVVLINFFFTSCTSICPRTTGNLVKVEEALGEHVGRDVVMISITVDPKTDTPAVLQQYARRYGTKPGWHFVTGDPKDLENLRRRLGANRDGGDKTQHTGILIYGNDATGQWAATPAMGDPQGIARSVLKLAKPAAATAPPPDPRTASATNRSPTRRTRTSYRRS